MNYEFFKRFVAFSLYFQVNLCTPEGLHVFSDNFDGFVLNSCICSIFASGLVHVHSRLMTKPTKWHVRPAKTQISLGIRPVWSESSLCAKWVAKYPVLLHADSEDSYQTGRMPRLIWVFTGRTSHFVGFVMRWLMCTESSIVMFWNDFHYHYSYVVPSY